MPVNRKARYVPGFYDSLPRVIVIVGSFGSGKSELAINLALHLAASGREDRPVCLVDLDLVNAYFRTREVRQFLEENGIQPVVPQGDVLYSDLPISGPGVINLLKDSSRRVILDVGGDEMGAVALAGMSDIIRELDHRVLMVVNPYRPFTRDVRSIIEMRDGIESASGLKVHGLLSNPHLGPWTTFEGLESGSRIVESAATAMRVPVEGTLILQNLAERWGVSDSDLPRPILPARLYLSPEWLRSGSGI